MGQYKSHVFVCTSGDSCLTQGNAEQFVNIQDESAGCRSRPTSASTRPAASPSAATVR